MAKLLQPEQPVIYNGIEDKVKSRIETKGVVKYKLYSGNTVLANNPFLLTEKPKKKEAPKQETPKPRFEKKAKKAKAIEDESNDA